MIGNIEPQIADIRNRHDHMKQFELSMPSPKKLLTINCSFPTIHGCAMMCKSDLTPGSGTSGC